MMRSSAKTRQAAPFEYFLYLIIDPDPYRLLGFRTAKNRRCWVSKLRAHAVVALWLCSCDKKVGIMKRLLLLGALLLAVTAPNRSMAADAWGAWTNGLPTAWVEGPACDPYVDYNCPASKAATAMALKAARGGPCDPYLNYSCLDAYLGDDVATRFFRYYQLEWGKGVAPSDPKAPPGRRSDADWPATPKSSPPMPFTEWPYGGTQSIGVTRPNSVDSPLMVSIANTQLGKAMSDAHIQVYGCGRARRRYQQQYGQTGRQRAGCVRLHAKHRPARPGRRLRRAARRHCAERPLQSGLPFFDTLRRRLSLHDGSRPLQQSTSQQERRLWRRPADGVYGPLLSGDASNTWLCIFYLARSWLARRRGPARTRRGSHGRPRQRRRAADGAESAG